MVSMFLHRWVTPYRGRIGVGLGCWGLCSVAAVVYASQSGATRLPIVVTWNEWLVALLLIPALVSGGSVAVWLRWTAAIVFGLDLLVRALFRLGWQPFF